MNVVDSSGWIEFFMQGANAEQFEITLHDFSELIVPTTGIFEVYRLARREKGLEVARECATIMKRGQVVELSADLAGAAAEIAHKHKLAMADAIILATPEKMTRPSGRRTRTSRRSTASTTTQTQGLRALSTHA